MEHHLTFGTKSGYFGPYDDLFRGQKAGFVTIGGHKGNQFAHKITILGASKRAPVAQKWISYVSSVMPGQYVDFGITSGAIKTSRGSKVPFYGVMFILT